MFEEKFVHLPVDPTREIKWDLTDGSKLIEIPDVTGCRIKPVVFINEESLAWFDRNELKKDIEAAGAVYCKVPTVHVVRKKSRRDERHQTDLPIEESLRLFGEETKVSDLEEKIAFALALAVEADSGVSE